MTDYSLIIFEVIAISATISVEASLFSFAYPDIHSIHHIEPIWLAGAYLAVNLLMIIQDYRILPWLPPKYQNLEFWAFGFVKRVNPLFGMANQVSEFRSGLISKGIYKELTIGIVVRHYSI